MKRFVLTIAALTLWTVGACAETPAAEDTTHRVGPPAALALDLAKADAPGWFTPAGAIASGATVSGDFEGADSAHLYRYDAVAGHRLSLEAEVDYHSGAGLALAVYGPDGELVDYALSRSAAAVSIEVVAETEGVYEIGIFSWSWRATGAYRLSLSVPCGSRGLTFDCGEGAFCRHALDAVCGWADAPGAKVAG